MRQSAFSDTFVQWGLSTIAGLCKDGIGRCLLAYSGGFEHSVQCHKHPKQISSVNGSNRPGADFRSGGTATRFRRRADISTGVVTVQSTWSGNFAGQPYVSASSSKRLRRISCLKSSANAVTKSGDVNSVVLSFFTTKNLLSLNHSISG